MTLDILLIRHAIAEEREVFAKTGQADDLRPLTAKGEKRMRKQARALKTLVPDLHRIAHSPLMRATQTAEIIAEYYPTAQLEVLEALAPDGYYPLLRNYLRDCEFLYAVQAVALVGHEPDLGRTAARLLSEPEETQYPDWLPMKKGSVCNIALQQTIDTTHAELRWFLTPAQLRLLDDSHAQTT